nr:leucine-rich repeat protein [Butyrivibrio sp.]
ISGGNNDYTLGWLFGIGINNLGENSKNTKKYSALKEVTLTGNITEIKSHAFYGWTQLEKINYPDSVTTIGSCAFYNCSSLKQVILPAGMKKINSYAYNGCTNLEEILVYADNLDISSIPVNSKAADSHAEGTDSGNISYKETVIYGHIDSKAEEYALDKNVTFIDIDESYAPVTYVLNNGSNDVVKYERIGELISKPADPYFNGYNFDKWYFDEALTEPWDFDYDLLPACGVTLYADWNADKNLINSFVYEECDDYCIITGYVGSASYVNIPDKIKGLPVKKLGSMAFAYDSDIRTVIIPKTVEEIAKDCFVETENLNNISVSTANDYFVSVDGVLFDKEQTRLILYPAGKTGDIYTIPETVSEIGYHAFEGSQIKEIICNEGLEIIEDMAFSRCEFLVKVTLPSTVNSFGSLIFWDCSKVNVYGPMDNEIIEEFAAVEGVSYNMYTLCFESDSEIIESCNVKAGELISDQLKQIISGLNKDTYELASWIVSSDDSGKIWDFDNDVMPQSNLTLRADWACVFTYDLNDEGAIISGVGVEQADYIIPDTIDGYSIVGISTGAFTSAGIESVTIPSNVTSIEEGAFHDGIVIIADEDSFAASFAKEGGLDFKARKYAVTYESNGGTQCSIRYYAKGSLITYVPTPVKDNNIFEGWYTDRILSDKWDFDADTMPGEAITLYANWNKINENIEDDVFSYETSNGKLSITGYSGKSEYIEIPESINGLPVIALSEYVFAFNEDIKRVTIPESVTNIGRRAFYDCKALESIELSTNITEIGEAAFAGCGSLNNMDLSSLSLTEISDSCFMHDINLYNVYLPETITEIGDYAFAGCTYLQNIDMPDTVTSLGEFVFFNDKVLSEITIPGNVSEIGEGFVNGCSSLKSITAVSNGIYSSEEGILYRQNRLIRCPEAYCGDVFVKDSAAKIEDKAFYNCSLINSVTLGKLTAEIGEAAFSGCNRLTSLNFATENKVSVLSDSMLYGCQSLTGLNIPDEITTISRMALANCISLTSLTIKENVTSIGSSVFFGDDNLTVYGYADSAIAKYAAKNSTLKFEYLADKALTPDAPVAESVVNTTITLKAYDGYEYKMNDGNWQTSNVFSDLEPVTAYTFYQRVAESPYVHESNSSKGTVIVSGKLKSRKVKTPVILKITSSSVKLAKYDGCEYSIDGINYKADTLITNLSANTEYTVYQRFAQTDIYDCGDSSSITFTTKAHTGPCTVTFNLNGGILEGYDNEFSFEYKEGDTATDPGTPERKGYVFGGWYYNDTVFDFTSPLDNDIELRAMWTIYQQCEAPTSNIESLSIVSKNTMLILSTKTIDADIYYTTDGSDPDEDSTLYDGPITITEDATIKAVSVKDNYVNSEILTIVLTLETEDDYGDVSEEDIPESGISEGLWVAGLEDAYYTGKSITQNLRVYDYKTLLTEKTDYKLIYKNNIKAGTATVIVTGIGKYSGTLSLDFEILPLDISGDEYSAGDIFAAYNKKAQKPSVTLYKGSYKLKNNTDYAISWTNEDGKENVGCKAAGEYTVTIIGKGNYTGSREVTFHITDSTLITKVRLKIVKSQAYTGSEIHPEVVLTDKKYTLEEGSDYEITWPLDCTSVGTVNFTITGIGNYAGVRNVSFAITGTTLSKAKMSGFVKNYDYTGNEITQSDVVFKKGNDVLVMGEDYSVSYENNINAGSATVIYTGIGGYTGTVKKTFKINGIAIKSATVSGISMSYSYNGEAIEPAGSEDDNTDKGDVTLTYKDPKTKVKSNLEKGTDYTVTYKNNTGAGTATITFTGTGKYTGSISKTFKITAYNITEDEKDYITVSYDSTVSYVKNGVKPDVTLYFRGEELIAGTDYSVTYANNNAVTTENTKKLPAITIKGKGNLTGKYNTLNFTIEAQDISNMDISVADKLYVKKAKAYISAPIITDPNSNLVKLVAGKDYNKTITYTYGEDTTVTQLNGKISTEINRSKGENIGVKDILPVGTIVKVEAEGINNYSGSITAYYKIMQSDISKAKVKIADQTYTGEEICLSKEDITSITLKNTAISSSNYEITSYSNNIEVGTATVIIKGKGIYGGTLKATFKIVKKSF